MEQKLSDQKIIERQIVSLCQVLKALLISFVVLSIITLFTGCVTTQKTEQNTAVSHRDSTETQNTQQVVIRNEKVNFDSLFTAWQQRIEQSQTTNEQSHETVSETITSWIDSLGREVRQEQRTIDRDLARQTEIRHQQEIAAMQQQFSQQLERYDSLYAAMEKNITAHWEDSLASYKESITQSQKPSLLERFHDWLTAFINIVVIAVIVGCIIRCKRFHKLIE